MTIFNSENSLLLTSFSIAAVVLVAMLAYWFSRKAFEHHLKKDIDSGSRTGITFLRNAVKAAIVVGAVIGIVYCIPPLRSLAVGFFAGASILAAFIGFASQNAFSNIVSGVFIVLFKPFRVGDIIKIRDEIGTVEDITLRHTIINALENKRLIYPNSVIDSEAVTNWTIKEEKVQKFMFLSIDLDSDVDLAVSIIQEEALRHPDLLDERSDDEKRDGVPLVNSPILDFNGAMINFRIPLWAKDLPTSMGMIWDLQKSIRERFEEAGVAIGRPSQVNFEGKL
ncbi:mechanosensitive ion channel family protein [Puniceicoccaceae bacterium K14]|nr:mechanosensitive ion channel family protein [Puniceicoccaceae bacterium K14]